MATDNGAVAYLNHGRWVAHCPRPGCSNAEQFGNVGMRDGSPGGLRGDSFECRGGVYGGCGYRCGVIWPAEIAAIERLVRDRPVVNRNWLPGEDLHDLIAENMSHGYVPNDDLTLTGSDVQVGRIGVSWSAGELPPVHGV